MEDIFKIFGERVRELRKAKSLSQEEYASFVGINLKTLWNIETAKRSIHFNTIKKIVLAENIPVYKLFMTKEEQKANNKNEILEFLNKLSDDELDAVKNLLKTMAKK